MCEDGCVGTFHFGNHLP